jgi:hypothetical protein
MPQFDFYTWSALSFWTIFFFHCLYLFLLYFVVSSISEFQKTLKKLSFLLKKEKKTITILDFFGNLYLNKSSLN